MESLEKSSSVLGGDETVLVIDRVGSDWKRDVLLNAIQIEHIRFDSGSFDTCADNTHRAIGKNPPEATIIFLQQELNDDNIDKHITGHCMKRALEKAYSVPPVFWSTLCARIQGFFGSDTNFDSARNLMEHRTWFRFMIKRLKKKNAQDGEDSQEAIDGVESPCLDPKYYNWCRLMFYTRWLATGQTVIVCTSLDDPVRKVLCNTIKSGYHAENVWNPYWPHRLILQTLVGLWDDAVWDLQPLVKEVELAESNHCLKLIGSSLQQNAPVANYPKLHEILRYALHHSECLQVAVDVVKRMSDEHLSVSKAIGKQDPKTIEASESIQKWLLFQIQILSFLQIRATAYKNRMDNEITLSFNSVSQYDTRVSVEIGRAQLVDSIAMRTIAFLTLAFLPGTLVCTIFGSSFFVLSPDRPDRLVVSDKFWLLWAIALPITFLTIVGWYFWQRSRFGTGMYNRPRATNSAEVLL